MKPVKIVALGLGLGMSMLLGASGGIARAEEEPDHVEYEHRFVRITATRVRPETLALGSDQAIGWVNYSSQIARVSFDKEIAEKMTCRSPGGFRLTGDRLESNDIQSLQFASLCRLAPGEYTYRVVLFAGAGSLVSPPSTTQQGKIVVR